jgi:hypothetical protein
MQALQSSKMLVTTCHYIHENSRLHSHCCGNLKSSGLIPFKSTPLSFLSNELSWTVMFLSQTLHIIHCDNFYFLTYVVYVRKYSGLEKKNQYRDSDRFICFELPQNITSGSWNILCKYGCTYGYESY